MKYNHDRPLSDFQYNIDRLRAAGFNPIAVSQLYFEEVFVFETEEEATCAYKQFEYETRAICAWWYSKAGFLKAVAEYETENGGYSRVRIHWLDDVIEREKRVLLDIVWGEGQSEFQSDITFLPHYEETVKYEILDSDLDAATKRALICQIVELYGTRSEDQPEIIGSYYSDFYE